jgi:hypothetical protein
MDGYSPHGEEAEGRLEPWMDTHLMVRRPKAVSNHRGAEITSGLEDI